MTPTNRCGQHSCPQPTRYGQVPELMDSTAAHSPLDNATRCPLLPTAKAAERGFSRFPREGKMRNPTFLKNARPRHF
jgi:hypothetical protein